MPKVYETDRGKPSTNFTLYPSWRCPSCQQMRREALAKSCRKCKEKRDHWAYGSGPGSLAGDDDL